MQKGRGSSKNRTLLYFSFITGSNIFAQILYLKVKKSKDISIWLILANVMNIFVENFWTNSNSSHLICWKSIFCYFTTVFKLKVCKKMRFFFGLLFFEESIYGPPGRLRVKFGKVSIPKTTKQHSGRPVYRKAKFFVTWICHYLAAFYVP